MHQTMKKAWALVLTLCLLVGLLPIGAQAALLQGEDYITQQISLGEDLVLHLRASLPEQYEDLAKDAVGTLTYAGRTTTYTMSDLTPDANGMYDMPVEMAVKEMTDDIHAVVTAKVLGVNQEIINEHYSIRDYLEAIIEGDYSQTTKDLCLELLNMGAWAQLYFNHNISDLANKNYSTSVSNPVPDETPVVRMEGAVDGVRLYGTSVRFLSQTAMRFYFKVDGAVDDYTFTIDGVEYEPVGENGIYYIETPGINPQNMSTEITASVTDGTSTVSAYYAPIWYFIRTYHKTKNEYNKGLMEAAYSYYKTAESYKTQICMDVEFTTLGNSTEDIELGFYPLGFEGSIHEECPERVAVKAGTTTTVKVDQGNLLVDGEFLGIGVVVFGGPEWNTTLEDGSNDKHAFTISNMRLEGPEDRAIDLRSATVTTGFGGSNSGGTATMANSTLTVTNGIRYDGHMITFNEVDTYLALDMEITTLSNSTDALEVGFYPYGFDGSYSVDYTDKLTLTAGTTNTVYLDAGKYLVDGELPGIGFVVFGGPEWNTQISDGVYDRHAVKVSNVRLEGDVDQTIDMTNATVATGFAGSNGGGTAAVVDGTIEITNGYRYDGHMITFVGETEPEETEPTETEPTETEPVETEPVETEPVETEPPVEEFGTSLCLDMQIDTLGGDWANDIEIRFYNYGFEGNPHETYTDSVIFKAGEQTAVELDAEKYLVDGQLTGIGIGIFGGPAWDAKLPDGYTPDRHTVTISNVHLEGLQSTAYDLSKSAIASGTANTGYTAGNGNGKAVFGESIVISDGFCYDVHKISLVEDTNTYIEMDVLLTTLSNSTDPIEVRFFPYNYTGSVGDSYTDLVNITAGTATTVKLNLDNYLVDGELTGIGFAIMGGPAWDAKLPDGYTPDRHTVTISNARLEGAQSKVFDLSKSQWTSGTNAGYSWANGSGTAEIGSSIVISNGFQYDGHKITLVEDTNTYIEMDLLITTQLEYADPIDVRFYATDYTDSVHNGYTNQEWITIGTKTTVRFKVDEYLVDGKLTGFGIAIFGGPEWNTQISDGVYDRHSVVISNLRLTGVGAADIDLSAATASVGLPGSNSGGQIAIVDGEIVITGGFRYDGHKIVF